MKEYIILALASLSLVALSACSAVTSSNHTNGSLTGESWYVKNTSFLGLVFSAHAGALLEFRDDEFLVLIDVQTLEHEFRS